MAWSDWIGRTESSVDTITVAPALRLAATLDRDDPPPQPGDPLPPLWHWLYCLPLHRQSELDADGHARRGAFLPPVPLPRRLYAGGRIDIHDALRFGDRIERLSRVEDISEKEGRSGPLVFVKVRHRIVGPRGLALVEDHDIVYRDRPMPPASGPAARAGAATVAREGAPSAAVESLRAHWRREIRPDESLLFRYSALTFNAYRIHYDRPYATGVQGYAGLVVHAPLVATLLADLVRRQLPLADISSFTFRALRPLVDGRPIELCGRMADEGQSARLWAVDAEGLVAFEATAGFRAAVSLERSG